MESVASLAAQVCGQPAHASLASVSCKPPSKLTDPNVSKASQPKDDEASLLTAAKLGKQQDRTGVASTSGIVDAPGNDSLGSPRERRTPNATDLPGHGTQLAAAALQELHDVARVGVKGAKGTGMVYAKGQVLGTPGTQSAPVPDPGATASGPRYGESLPMATGLQDAAPAQPRGRGRPRKHARGSPDEAGEQVGNAPKRGRGRPRKIATAEASKDATTSQVAEQATPPKRGRGRPPKALSREQPAQESVGGEGTPVKRGPGRPPKHRLTKQSTQEVAVGQDTLQRGGPGCLPTVLPAEQAEQEAPVEGRGGPQKDSFATASGDAGADAGVSEQPSQQRRGRGRPRKFPTVQSGDQATTDLLADGNRSSEQVGGAGNKAAVGEQKRGRGRPRKRKRGRPPKQAALNSAGPDEAGPSAEGIGGPSGGDAEERGTEALPAQKRERDRPVQGLSQEKSVANSTEPFEERVADTPEEQGEVAWALQKRGRGRPRKMRSSVLPEEGVTQQLGSLLAIEPPQKRGRGRPRKGAAAVALERADEGIAGIPRAAQSAPVKRGPGRPRKGDAGKGTSLAAAAKTTVKGGNAHLRDAVMRTSVSPVPPGHSKHHVLALLSTCAPFSE
jgi:hypothetical protein